MDIRKKVDELFNEIVAIRRDFHMHPELSEEEYETMQRICNYLDNWGIEYKKGIGKTGVVAIIGKGEGRCVAARAEMDALPVNECNELPFKSANEGIMHACGHDIHLAIHLGLARILKEMEEEIDGTVKIIFQPAEETIGGAKYVIEDGALMNPYVDYIISLHVSPQLEVGEIELKHGIFNAASDEFSINIKGKSSHAAYPEQSVDAIVVSGYIITALQTLVSRNISPLNSVVLTLGKINGGRKNNIIANEVKLSGTLRTLTTETRNYAKNRMTKIVKDTAKAFGAEVEIEFEVGYPALENDEKVLNTIISTAERLLGKEKVNYKEGPSMGSDDFSFYCQETKGAYYNIGCGNKSKGWNSALHTPEFRADEESIRVGMFLQTEILLELLNI